MRSTRRFLAVLALLLAVLLLHACKDDDITGTGSPTTRMELLWPNDDGHEWQFDMKVKLWNSAAEGTSYPSADLVPPMPPLDELMQRLETPITDEPATSEEWNYRMAFDGMAQTASGVKGQNLYEAVVPFLLNDKASHRSRNDAFFSRLLRARPDLRDRILEICPALAQDSEVLTISHPLFLHGGVFEKTRLHIGAYGDLDTLLAWKWLEANISQGHEFVHQLVPGLADDVFLHARILGEQRIQVPSGMFPRAVVVLYALDYGVSEAVGSDGNSYGAFRTYQYGEIAFAPDVGPIWSHERLPWNHPGPGPVPVEERMLELQPRPVPSLDVPVPER